MKKTKFFTVLLLWLLALPMLAQMPERRPMVRYLTGDSAVVIAPSITQTELKPGWKIVDIQTRGRRSRYLWGKHSRQFVDDARPSFIITPEGGRLVDVVLIKLKEKKDHRRLPEYEFTDCDYRRFDLDLVEITVNDDDSYVVKPHEELEAGEYIITDLRQPPVNELGDREVYAFTVVR